MDAGEGPKERPEQADVALLGGGRGGYVAALADGRRAVVGRLVAAPGLRDATTHMRSR